MVPLQISTKVHSLNDRKRANGLTGIQVLMLLMLLAVKIRYAGKPLRRHRLV